MDNQKVFAMSFSKIYLLYIQKAERKNRTKEEVDEIICWLTAMIRRVCRRRLTEMSACRHFLRKRRR